MPVVRSYGLPEVEARPVQNPYPQVPAAGEIGLFGGNQARDLQVAGQNLGQTSDNVFGIYARMAKEANDTKVESDLNGFIEAKQKTVADFVQLKGDAAVQGSQAASDGLLKLKTQYLDGAKNAYQRESLARRLDAQILDATGTITSHTATQATAWQKDTLTARSALVDRDGVMKRDDPNALEGQLAAKATIGLEQARLAGAPPDSDVAKEFVLKEQEKYLVGVLQAKIGDGNKRAALALYDKYENILKPNNAVASVMKGVRTEIDGENTANAALAKVGLPPIRSGDNSPGGSGSKDEFIQKMTPHVLEAAEKTGLDPRLIMAQSALETGYGRAAPGNNYFGVKSHGKSSGQTLKTTEVGPGGAYETNESFRAYGSPAESAADYADFIKSNSRYAPAMAAKGLDAQIEAMGKSGYATDPNYAAKLKKIAESLPDLARGAGVPPYKGDLKAGYDQASLDIQNRTDIPAEVRSSALAALSKQATTITSYQTAAEKALKDEADSYRTIGYLNPAQLDPAKLASFADRAAALGNQSLATTYRLYASIAPSLKDGLQAAPADTLKLLKSLEEGPAKKLLEGITGGGEDLTTANDLWGKVQQGQKDGLNVAGMKDMATQAFKLYTDAGKREKAQEVAQTYGAMVAASDIMKGNPVAQKQAMAGIEAIASDPNTQVNAEQATLHGLLKDGIAKQQTEFDRDAFAAGQKLYGLPTLPLTDGAGRAQQAARIASARGLRPDQIPPMSNEDFAILRSQMGGSPQAAQKVVQDIVSAGYPPETIPLIGAGIAGKGPEDPASMGYAAAVSFAADREPETAAAILDGVHKRKTMGDALRDFPKSDVFRQATQDRMGNAFKNLPGNVPAIVVNAAEAIYTSRMISAGRQNEKALDEALFGQSLDAVMGKVSALRGQSFVMPKGVEAYQFNNALRQLADANLPGLVTENGSPVAGDKIARYGMLSNAGRDGLYFVEMNDPARDGKPAYVQGPDGRPFTVDIKPLLERAKQSPPLLPGESAAGAARRRAPASPTANVEP